ncbi:T3SS effector HopA1 family protein [Nonomuraea cavernae]|uniref:T3SS effector HopA1 family protein n=1 Tax=Nonomuraea cavernae TaxID=2045107 RepID=UPI003404C044
MDPNVFVPDVLKPFWPYIAGGVFPEQRYDDMVAKADEQDVIADKLGRLRKEAGDGVVALLQSGAWEGVAKAEFVQLLGELVRDAGGDPAEADRDPVAVLAYVEHELRQGADMTRKHATDVEHTQWMMIAGAILTALAILRLLAFAVANPGATALIWSRLGFERVRNQAIKGIVLRNMLLFGAIMGGLDGGVQFGQLLAGHRDEINFESLLWSSGTGALTGALFGGMKIGAAKLVTDDMVGAVAKNEAKTVRTLLAGASDTVMGQAVMGGVSGATAGAVTLGATGQLTRDNLLFSLTSGVLGGIGPTAARPRAMTEGGPGLLPARHSGAADLAGTDRPGGTPRPGEDGAAPPRPSQPEASPARGQAPPAERPTMLAQQPGGSRIRPDQQVWPQPKPEAVLRPVDDGRPAALAVSNRGDRAGPMPYRSTNDGAGTPVANRNVGDRPGMADRRAGDGPAAPVAGRNVDDWPRTPAPDGRAGEPAAPVARPSHDAAASHPGARPVPLPESAPMVDQGPRAQPPAVLADGDGMPPRAHQSADPPDAGHGGWRPGAEPVPPFRNAEAATGQTVAGILGLGDVSPARAEVMGRFDRLAPEVLALHPSASRTLNNLVEFHGGRHVVTSYVRAVEAGHPVARAADAESLARGIADFMRSEGPPEPYGRRRHAEIARRHPELSFAEVEQLRLRSYRQHGLEPPPLSRESTAAFLEQVWRERSSIGSEHHVYDRYADGAKIKPLHRTPESYLNPLVETARARSEADSFTQRTERSVSSLDYTHVGNGMEFFSFRRTDGDVVATQRLYLHATPDMAPELMSALVKNVVDEPQRFPGVHSAKISGYREVTLRGDGIVVYLADRAAADRVLQWLDEYGDRHPGVFLRDTPPMTLPLREGVGLGMEPTRSGTSFGQLRSRSVFQALRETESAGGDLNLFRQKVDEHFRRAGIDPVNPHANQRTGSQRAYPDDSLPAAELASPFVKGGRAAGAPLELVGLWMADSLGLGEPSPAQARVLGEFDRLAPGVVADSRSSSRTLNRLVELHGPRHAVETYVAAVEAGHEPVIRAPDAELLARGLADFIRQQESPLDANRLWTHADLARRHPELSFAEVEEVRQHLYRQQGLEAPALSRLSTDDFLERVWAREQKVSLKRDDIYSMYAVETEKPLHRTPESYMKELADLARTRPEGYSVSQRRGEMAGLVEEDLVNQVSAWDFFHFIREDRSGNSTTQRLYLHVVPDGAPTLMRALVREVVDAPEDFPGVRAAKISGFEAIKQRGDGIVIYLTDQAATDRVLQWLVEYDERHPGLFLPAVPPMTQPVMDGVGLGAEPRVSGNSFGSLRSDLIFEALVDTRSAGGDLSMFKRKVDEYFRRGGVEPDNPHVNASGDRR